MKTKSVDEMIKLLEKKLKLNEDTYDQKNSLIEQIEELVEFRHASWESFSEPQLNAILQKLQGL